MKKKIGVFLIILFCFILVYREYRVLNVLDEMFLTGKKFFLLPYTKTSYINMDIENLLGWSDVPLRKGLKSDFVFTGSNNLSIEVMGFKNNMEIAVLRLKYEYAEVRLDYDYNVWAKKLQPTISVYEYMNGERTDGPVENIDYAEKLLHLCGTSIDGCYEQLNQGLDELIQTWIYNNENKSKFSETNYGRLKILPVKYIYE